MYIIDQTQNSLVTILLRLCCADALVLYKKKEFFFNAFITISSSNVGQKQC